MRRPDPKQDDDILHHVQRRGDQTRKAAGKIIKTDGGNKKGVAS